MTTIITLRSKNYFIILGGISSLILFFTNAENVKSAFIESLYFCVKTLIPSIFIFMVLSSFLLYSSAFSGIIDSIPSKAFSKLGICKKYASHIILCSFCGFVNGPKAICEDFKKNGGSNTAFSNAVILSTNAGFGFLAGCVGARIWGDTLFGVLLFFFQILSSFLLGKLILDHSEDTDQSIHGFTASRPSLFSAFSRAVSTCAMTCISICAFVIVFSCFISVATGALGIQENSPIYALISLICEFCKGSFLSLSFKSRYLCAFFSGFCVGFGGICVHFQTFSVCEGFPLDKKRFIAFKLLHGILCGIFSVVYMLIKDIILF